MSSEKKVLFAHWDGGRGHISRVLDVAAESKRRGMKIGIVTTKAIKSGLPFEFDAVYDIPTRPPTQPDSGYDLPLYSHARSHGQRLLGIGFSEKFIIDTNKRELGAIDSFRPDIIVNDYRDTIKNVADLKSIPLLSIVQSNGHTGGQELGWFMDIDDPDKPSCLGIFNTARASMGLSAVSDEREMFMGDRCVVPSIPEIDPIHDSLRLTDYVGLLSYRQEIGLQGDDSLDDIAERYVVCNVAAANRKRYGQDALLKKVSDSLPLDVISTGESAANVERVRTRFGKFIAQKCVDYDKILPLSSAFISYGGHGSTLAALMHGVPIVGLGPFSSEQRGTLENIQSYGAGIVIPHDTEIDFIEAPDMDNLKIYGNWHTSISSEDIIGTLDAFLHQSLYSVRAMELAIRLRRRGGSKRVNDIIMSLL